MHHSEVYILAMPGSAAVSTPAAAVSTPAAAVSTPATELYTVLSIVIRGPVLLAAPVATPVATPVTDLYIVIMGPVLPVAPAIISRAVIVLAVPVGTSLAAAATGLTKILTTGRGFKRWLRSCGLPKLGHLCNWVISAGLPIRVIHHVLVPHAYLPFDPVHESLCVHVIVECLPESSVHVPPLTLANVMHLLTSALGAPPRKCDSRLEPISCSVPREHSPHLGEYAIDIAHFFGVTPSYKKDAD